MRIPVHLATVRTGLRSGIRQLAPVTSRIKEPSGAMQTMTIMLIHFHVSLLGVHLSQGFSTFLML